MSHFTKGATKFREADCLIKALEELGFHPEFHAKPAALYGFQGDAREDTAHVIIRRSEIGPMSNDLGFLFGPDGTAEAVISDFDARRFNAAWLKKLSEIYGVHRALKTAKRLGQRAERRVNAKGKQEVVLTGGRW